MILQDSIQSFLECLTAMEVPVVEAHYHMLTSFGEGIYLGDGLWQELDISRFCANLKQWMISQALRLNQNEQASIVRQIQPIAFPNLQVLQLRKNRICSLEGLDRVYLPNLLKLYIGMNLITNLRGYARANFPLLSYLEIGDNPIREFDPLSLGSMIDMTWICIDWDDEVTCRGSLKWMLKTNTKWMRAIYAHASSRIIQKVVLERLRKRYVGIFIRLTKKKSI